MSAPEPTAAARPAGIEGSALPGPWPVGLYAERLRERFRGISRVQVFGEVWNLRTARTKVFFELRDANGALPCSMWRDEWDRLDSAGVVDGVRVVVGGGPDFYPGSRTSSPSFTFAGTELRRAGEGDLLAQVDRLRKQLNAEGLLALQKRLPRPTLPHTIGVVTGESGKARDDVLAGLSRQGWAGRLVWAFAPVQDRHAAPRIAQALRDLAACAAPDVIVVARGGGSLADLFAFCDEALCRTVALLPVPVIASVGHHTDRTLIDDVAAVSCSTPTHAAQSAVPLDCGAARARTQAAAGRLEQHATRAVLDRARTLAAASRAPAEHVLRHRRRLHQHLREVRASARRRLGEEEALTHTHSRVLSRQAARAAGAERAGRARDLEGLSLALSAHDPERTLARGYALVLDRAGEPVTAAADARRARELRLRFGDGELEAEVRE